VQVLSSLAKDLGFRANGFGGPRQQAVHDCRYSQTMFRPDVVPCFIGFVRVGRARNKKVRPLCHFRRDRRPLAQRSSRNRAGCDHATALDGALPSLRIRSVSSRMSTPWSARRSHTAARQQSGISAGRAVPLPVAVSFFEDVESVISDDSAEPTVLLLSKGNVEPSVLLGVEGGAEPTVLL